MQGVGGDGFLISTLFQRNSRRVITELTERPRTRRGRAIAAQILTDLGVSAA
jgi:hypothetical protein